MRVIKLLRIGIIGSGCSAIGLLFSKSFLMLLPLFVLGGVFGQLRIVSIIGYFLKSLSGSKSSRTFEMGAYTCVIAYAIGIGGFAGGILLALAGFDLIFVICASLMGTAFIASIWMPEAPGKLDQSMRILDIVEKLKEPKLLTVMLAMVLFCFHIGVEQTSFAPFLKEIGIGPEGIGILLAISGIILGSSALLGGRYPNWAGERFLILGLVASGIGNGLFALSNSFGWAFLARVVHDTGDGLFFLAVWLALVEPFKIFERGRISGFGFFGAILGMSIGALISGIMIEITGFAQPFILAAGLEGLAVILVLAAWRKFP